MSAAADPIETISNPLSGLAQALGAKAPELEVPKREAEAHPPQASGPRADIADAIVPPVPESIEETGIPPAIIEHLVLKYLYFRGEMLGREIASTLGLKFSLIDDLLETLKRQHHVGVKKSLGIGNSSGVFALTESGRSLTREYLENNLYAGPAPVPLYQYAEVVRRQKLRDNWLNPDHSEGCFPASGGGAGYPGPDRTGGKRQQILSDLRSAGEWKDRPGRVSVPGGHRPDLHALRD